MTDIGGRALDRELKKGSAELLILSLLEARPRHGYEVSKLIDSRSGGRLRFHIASLYPLLYRLEERGWVEGRLGREARRAPAPLLPAHARRPPRARGTARQLARVRGGRGPRHGVKHA